MSYIDVGQVTAKQAELKQLKDEQASRDARVVSLPTPYSIERSMLHKTETTCNDLFIPWSVGTHCANHVV